MVDLAKLRISVDSREVKDAKRELNGLGNSASQAGGSIKRMGVIAAAAFAAIGFAQIARDIFQANVEFQRLNAALAVAAGGAQNADAAFKEIREFAATTPYELNRSVEAFIKLKNLGLDPSMEALRSYGNTASSMGKDLMQMIEAVADATTGEFERLKEFGIKAKQEGDNVSLTFRGVTTTIGKNAAEIEKYLQDIGNNEFAGAMEAQMATLGGQVSNLKDNIYNLFIGIGEGGLSGAASSAIELLSKGVLFLTNNLGTLASIAAVIATRFTAIGAVYSAGFIKGYITEVIRLQMALGSTSKAGALFTVVLKQMQSAFLRLTAIMVVNPFVAIATAVAAVIAILYNYRDTQFEVSGQTVTIGNVIRGVWMKVKQVFDTVVKFMAEIWDGFSNGAAETWQGLGGFIGRVLSFVYENVKKYVNSYLGFFVGLWEGAKAIFTDESVSAAFMSAFEKDYVGGFIDQVKAGILELNNLGAAASAATASAAEAISGGGGGGGGGAGGAGSEPKVDQTIKQAEDFAEALKEQTKQMGKTAIEIKKMGIEAAIAAAPTEGLKNRIREAGEAWEKATRAQARRDFETNILQPLRNELALVGLTGDARARKQLELEKEAFTAKATADGIEDVNKAWEEYRALKTQIIDKESAFEKERKEAEKLKRELWEAADFLDMVKSGLGRKVEVVISNILKMSPDLKDQFKDIFKDLRKALDDVLGSLGTDLKKVAAGAAIGGIAGGVTGSRMGGSIGGGIGQALGEEFLPMLGKFAGPLGAIAGGILGGVIGGMVKSTPRASATIETIAGDAVVAGVRGNKGQLKTMAEGLAGSMIKGLQAIADEFSGTIAAGIKISIGVRKDTFRVDPLGLGRTKGMPSFKTEEEAIQYAIKLALERGAIEGIRESTKRLLEAGDDLQSALQDALDFEGVFDRLLEKTDPLAFGLKELEKEFDRLNKVFEKAGATTEEYAELQRLYDLERADILKEEQQRQMDEANKINDLILRIYREQGKEAEELALTRKMERDAATEAERAILDQIYALEDFNKARAEEVLTLENTIATMTQLAGSLRAFREGLYGADESVMNYKQALVDLIRVGSLASTGDVEALGQLQGVSQTFLASSKASARSLFDYQKDVALVASYVDQGIAAADEQVSAAEQQIDLLQQQLDELVNIAALLEQPTTPDVAIDPSWNANIAGGGGGNTATLPVDGSDMQAMLSEALYAIAKNTGNTAKLLDRWDGDGQPDIRELQSDYY